MALPRHATSALRIIGLGPKSNYNCSLALPRFELGLPDFIMLVMAYVLNSKYSKSDVLTN